VCRPPLVTTLHTPKRYFQPRTLRGQYADAYYGRASIYEKKGEKAKADEDFATAKKLGYKAR
jgi:hypothetical protein